MTEKTDFDTVVKYRLYLYGIEPTADLWDFAHDMYDLGWKDSKDQEEK